jgi:hypothetical protein
MEAKRDEAEHDRAKAELKYSKKTLSDAYEVLVFQDEVEIHRHPTRAWAPVGQHPKVPASGKNKQKVVYGPSTTPRGS